MRAPLPNSLLTVIELIADLVQPLSAISSRLSPFTSVDIVGTLLRSTSVDPINAIQFSILCPIPDVSAVTALVP